MSGSGTCADVCKELGIACMHFDIHDGFDACDPNDFTAVEMFDFIWSHPPYWRQKLYADDPRDLSRSPTLEHFLKRYRQFIRNCARSLKPGGRLAVLMGDYCDREAGFVPLTWHTKQMAFDAGLRQCCTDIIRFSHGASSSRKVYRSSFIPGLHDVCMIFEKTA
jgi:SAM-dependent methyltransferase